MINTKQHGDAEGTRLLVAITFHFVNDRLVYLDKVLRSLASFPISKRDIVVFTNASDIVEQESIRRLFHKAGLIDGCDARLEVEDALAHPFHLTWAHKRLIPSTFLAPDSPYTHFVYIEDDLHLTFENFVYFKEAREILRPFNLVPAFLRTEWSVERECCVSADAIAPIELAQRPYILRGDYAYVGVENPYCAGFILDSELAREYVNSRSFDLKRSCDVSPFNLRERAAMGLTFENPPAPFIFRDVVPVSIPSRITPQCAWLAHLPNNYADVPNHPYGMGAVAMTDLFIGDLNPKHEVTLLSFKSTKLKVLRLIKWAYRRLPLRKRTVLRKTVFERVRRVCRISGGTDQS